MKRFWPFFLALQIPFAARAVVDMRNANFHDQWTHMIVPNSTGYDLRLRINYSSRSLFNGVFGFGWCSDPETTLESLPSGTLRVTECGGGMKITYAPKGYNAKNDKTIETIMKEVKTRNQNAKADFFDRVRADLLKDESFRDEMIRSLNLKSDVKEGTMYYADGRENENIVLKGGSYVRTLSDGTNQRFDLQGRLTHMYDRTGNYLKMVYEKDRMVAVVDNNGRRISFTYNPANGKISKAVGPNNLTASFKYKDEDLVEVTNAWSNTFKYSYDDAHNLVRIDFPDKTFKALTYNNDKDWVTSFTNRKGCVENYTYGEDAEEPLNHYWSTVVKKCGSKITNQSRYEFFHKLNEDGTRYLHRAISDNNGDKTDIVYHPVFGKPLIINRNDIKVSYEYYENGLVKQKNEENRITAFSYKNSCQKISDITTKLFGYKEDAKTKKPKRFLAKTVKTEFRYEPNKCILIGATNTDGQTVRIAYDQRGRITQITDQARKTVQIKYEERFGKPEYVTRPGLGTIRVKYKADGEIDNVESKEGPLVAVQVASIFNNLLDLIAPATAEASL